ncbi:hypothetical protein [Marisediminicola sp. UYEF4]|uniref:hypothetical protein n=1 Tax=Marisediminicola sp. UYEF4 TaxID=1756384 RepID=UPI003393C163
MEWTSARRADGPSRSTRCKSSQQASGSRHALDLVRGNASDPKDAGEVSHLQALATAVSGTVGPMHYLRDGLAEI